MFTRITLIAFSIAAIVFSVHAQTGCDRTYAVHPGDTCNSISVSQNVSTYQLALVNPQIDAACDNLQGYEVLCLGIAGQDCNATYVVQSGDFCELIADEAGIPESLLFTNNPNVDEDCSNIGVGEVLCIANVTITYSQ